MRIVALADTHTFQADLGELPAGDLLIHAGDYCRAGRLDEFLPVARWLRALPFRHQVLIAGNHDWCFLREFDAVRAALGRDIIYLQDADVTIDGVRIWGSPWQPEFRGWAFNLPRGQPLAEKWEKIPTGIDVLVTHGPPAGIGDRIDDAERAGCEDLRAAVRRVKPLLHLFGHIHQSGGVWRDPSTCYANVTTWECERGPTVFDLDVVARTVQVVQVPPQRPRRNFS